MKNYPKIGRFLAIALIVAMLLPCISMTAFSQDIPCAEDGCSGKYRNGFCSKDATHYEAAPSEDGVYRISNAGQLYWFAALVNGGTADADAVLINDITINADMPAEEKLAWTPIGLYTSANEAVRYGGTFDGAGCTIYGLYYDNATYEGRNAGLFGTLDVLGTVKNLTLADSVINGATEIGGIVSHNYGTVTGCTQSGTVTGIGATGGIVCRNMDGGIVENCANTGSVTGAATGGIAAENKGSILGCANSGTVSGTNSLGGIVGINTGAVEDSGNTADVSGSGTHVGGVAGNLVGGSISGCANSGSVTGGSDYIGGVAGVCSGASITRSFNTGAVTGGEKSDAVGGVAGAIDGTNTAASAITSCYNTGTITGRSWVGGIAGISGYQNTPKTVEIRNSYNIGSVSDTSCAGTITGKLSKCTVSGSYYLSGGSNAPDGASAATAAQFASGEITWLLNGSTDQGELIWKQTLGADVSPCFEGLVVHFNSETGAYYNEGCAHADTELRGSKEVTCTEDGYTGDTYCTVCGEKLEDGQAIPALGHAWQGTFCTRCGETRENPFVDVPADSYYYDPVLWAVEKGITTGIDESHFNPGGACTRAVVVTFLWRAAGSPEPATGTNPFTDVSEGAYYYKAVLWAVENGITNGTASDKFSPGTPCNRAQVVTFLWRANGCAESDAAVSFTDVAPDTYYHGAVAWAVENGITNGISSTEFGAGNICNRGQVVTFLYRAKA